MTCLHTGDASQFFNTSYMDNAWPLPYVHLNLHTLLLQGLQGRAGWKRDGPLQGTLLLQDLQGCDCLQRGGRPPG